MTLTDIINKATEKYIEGAHDIVDTQVGVQIGDGPVVQVKRVVVKKKTDENWSDTSFAVILVGE